MKLSRIKTPRGDFFFYQHFLFVGSKQINKEIALENLSILTSILDKSKLRFGPLFGTLLGIIRDNDFITWDEDIDLYILKEDEELFLSILWDLKEVGFSLIRYERRGLYSIQRKGEYIDFYILTKVDSDIRSTRGGSFLLEKYVNEVIQWNFKGINLRIPEKYEEYLEFTYGDWKIPVKYANYEISSLKKIILRSIYRFKLYLPDFLYFFLIKHYHQNDFKKFLIKCASKGVKLENHKYTNSFLK